MWPSRSCCTSSSNEASRTISDPSCLANEASQRRYSAPSYLRTRIVIGSGLVMNGVSDGAGARQPLSGVSSSDWLVRATHFVVADELKKDILEVRQTNQTAPAFVLFHDR